MAATITLLPLQLNSTSIWHHRLDPDGSSSDDFPGLVASLMTMGSDVDRCMRLSVKDVIIVAEIGNRLLRVLQWPKCSQIMENSGTVVAYKKGGGGRKNAATKSTETLSNLNRTLLGLLAALKVCFIWSAAAHQEVLSMIKEFAYQTMLAYCSGAITQHLPSSEAVGHVISIILKGEEDDISKEKVEKALNLLLNGVNSRPFRLLLLKCRKTSTRIVEQLLLLGNLSAVLCLFGNPDDFPTIDSGWVDYTPWVTLAEGCRSVSALPELSLRTWKCLCKAIAVVAESEKEDQCKNFKYLAVLVAAGGLCGAPTRCRHSISVPTAIILSRIKTFVIQKNKTAFRGSTEDQIQDHHVSAADAIALSFAASHLAAHQHISAASLNYPISLTEREAVVRRLCELLTKDALALGRPIQNDDDMRMKEFAAHNEDVRHYKQYGGGNDGKWCPLLFFSNSMARAVGRLMGTLLIPSSSVDNGDATAAAEKTHTQRSVMTSLFLCVEALHHDAK